MSENANASLEDEELDGTQEESGVAVEGSISDVEQPNTDPSSDNSDEEDAERTIEENDSEELSANEISEDEENQHNSDESSSSHSSNDLRHQRQKLFQDAHHHLSAPEADGHRNNDDKGTNDLMANGGFGVGQNAAQVRSERSTEPTSNKQRRRRKISKAMKKPFQAINEESATSSNDTSHQPHQDSARRNLAEPVVNTTQYKLQASRHYVGPQNACDRIFSCLGCQVGTSLYNDAANSTLAGRLNNAVISYLHWSFRSSFAAVFISAALAFLALTMFFALLIWALGVADPSCIGGVDFNTDYFTDAYALSWTTFSTVGYGLIYSGISADEPQIQKCTGITIVVTLEAFVGVLFASFVGAIVFAKVSRVQSFAQVLFSDPIVIRYGSGVMVERPDEDEDDERPQNIERKFDFQQSIRSARSSRVLKSVSFRNRQDDSDSEDSDEENQRGPLLQSTIMPRSQQIACPVLEFRICNRLYAIAGGEILDATVNIVASVDASQKTSPPKGLLRRRRKKGRNRRMSKTEEDDPQSKSRRMSKTELMSSMRAILKATNAANRQSTTQMLPFAETHQAFEEDNTGHLNARRIFSKLEVETQDHPFFKRVWMVRHILDDTSPLLRPSVREAIRQGGGFWPVELNSAAGVRNSVQFDSILVSLSGTSNADANTVYSQKVYEYVDLSIGYRLANMLYRDGGLIKVDTRLINDVTEQSGGGGEPLATRPLTLQDKLTDMLVL